MSGTAEFLRRLIISGGIINLVIIAEYILMLTIAAERLVYYFMTSYNRKNCSRFCTLSRLTNVEPTRCQVFFLKNTLRQFPLRLPFILSKTAI